MTTFAREDFNSWRVPQAEDRYQDTIKNDIVLSMLIYCWIGSVYWPMFMCVVAFANNGLRANARDVFKVIENGYMLELEQMVQFGTPFPDPDALSHRFSILQKLGMFSLFLFLFFCFESTLFVVFLYFGLFVCLLQ